MDLRISKRTALLLLLDIVATYVAYWLASVLTDVRGFVFVNNEIYFMLGILALINVGVLAAFHLYNNLWEYASIDEALQIVFAILLSTLIGAVFLWVIDVRLPIRVFVVSAILLVLIMGGIRMVWRIQRRKKHAFSRSAVERPRTLVVGAGETGSLTIDRMASKDPNMPGVPIVATDDDPSKQGLRIHGVKVAGSSDSIVSLVERFDIEQIVVAIPSATAEERKRIYAICTETDCSLKTLPNIRELRVDELEGVALRDVEVTDLLGREEIMLDTRIASSYIAGKAILVTGGGGSIGSELCRQLAKVAPERIVIFDMYENDAYMLRQELMAEYHHIEVVIEIGNVCDAARINEVFEKYRPSAVFHAAAHKHVPLMEVCPREAVQNNVFGTLNVVHAADSYGASHFIFISTDKAVNPTSVMGATKRMGEMVMQYYAHTSKTIFTASPVRQCARLQWQCHTLVQAADSPRRAGDGHASGHTALLHDDTGSGPVGHPGRRHGQRRRDIHSRHGRAGEDRRFGEEPHSLVGTDGRRGHRDNLHGPARWREDVRRAAHGRRGHASHRQRLHYDIDRAGDRLRRSGGQAAGTGIGLGQKRCRGHPRA